MKKLLTLILIIFSISIYSQNNYIKHVKGYAPILITAGHGGTIRDENIRNRDCDINECNSDLYTDKLAVELYSEFLAEGIWPHLLVNDLHRQELDVNREPEEACVDDEAAVYYNEYHSKILSFIEQHVFYSDYILILDIHGQSHDHGFIELGYNINHNELQLPNLNMNITSSLHNVKDYNLNQVVRGQFSLGSLYYQNTDDYKITPSPKYPVPPLPYFNGGYTTEKYKEYKNVIVIQIELPFEIRKNKQNRQKFIKTTAKVVDQFYKIINKHEKQ